MNKFLEVVKNASFMAYLGPGHERADREALPEKEDTAIFFGKDLRCGATYIFRTETLGFEADSSRTLKVSFCGNDAFVEVASAEAKRLLAMAIAVAQLLGMQREEFLRVFSIVAAEVRAAGWNWPETLKLLVDISAAAHQNFDQEAFGDAENSFRQGSDNLNKELGDEKARLFRFCLSGADRK